MLEASGLTVRFGGLAALEDAHLSVGSGEIHGIIGPNGAGKTTLFDVLTGVYRPKGDAKVMLDGVDVSGWAPHRRTRAGLARSFQTVGLAPSLTAADNVLATFEALDRVWNPFPRPQSTRRRRESVDELLAFFGIEDAADTLASSLPLGTSKLLELCKVFAGSPKVVLLDEPLAGLSTAEGSHRLGLIAARRAEINAGVVIVEHDVALLLEHCDRLTVLDQGRVVVCDEPHAILQNPDVRKAYLGELSEA